MALPCLACGVILGPKKTYNQEGEGARVMMISGGMRQLQLSSREWLVIYGCVLSAVYCPDVFAHVAVHACTGRGCPDDGRVVFIT